MLFMVILHFTFLILYSLIDSTSLIYVKLFKQNTLHDNFIMSSENDYNKTYLSTPSTISDQTPHLITML